MKTIPQKPSGGIARIATLVIATLGLSAATSLALPAITLGLYGQDFGHGNTISLSSGAKSISPSSSFSYTLTGTIQGTGGLASLVPKGTHIDTFVNSLVPGGASLLSGTVDNPNPGGALTPKLTLISKTYAKTRRISGVGKVKISFDALAQIQTTGKVTFDVKNVIITKNGTPIPGSIKFEAGSKIKVTVAPEIEFKMAGQNIDEDAGTVQVVVTRYKNTTSQVTVDYATADDTATSADYTAKSGTLTFPKGSTSQTITINVTPNTVNNTPRKFRVNLSNPTGGAALGGRTSEIVNIIDND